MTNAEALQLVAQLVTTTNGWDDASVMTWAEMIADLDDNEAAVIAVKLVARTWVSTQRPTWGRFMEIYQQQPRKERNALAGPSGRVISQVDYLQGLRRAADAGNHSALTELHRWERIIGSSDTWLRSIAPLDNEVIRTMEGQLIKGDEL